MTDGTLLHRQINPKWVQRGRVTSQAFRPTPKDKNRLSVYNGDLIGAAEAWAHFTAVMGFHSVGVMAVTVLECKNEALSAAPDPEPFPEHAVIDFSGLGANQIKSTSQRLRRVAAQRDWQYQATAND